MMDVAALASRAFSQRLTDFLNKIEIRSLTTQEDKEAVFRLRYQAYLREGMIAENETRKFTDGFDETPNAWIFGIYVGGSLASSIRIHVASPQFPNSPALATFPDLLGPEIDRGRTVVDPTRFVADHALARNHPELPYASVRLGFLACEFFDADLGLATVRAEHQAFYHRLFELRPLCDPRPYPGLEKPITLMAAHYPMVRRRITERFPFLRSTSAELRTLFEGALSVRAPRDSKHDPAVARPRYSPGRTQPGRAASDAASGGQSRHRPSRIIKRSGDSDS